MEKVSRGFWMMIIAIGLNGLLSAQGSSRTKSNKPSPHHAATQEDVEALRDTVQAQQKQIAAQIQQMQELQNQLRQVIQMVQQANGGSQKVQAGADQAEATAIQAQQASIQAQNAAVQAASSAATAASAASALQGQSKEEQARLESLQSILARFRFSGDVRVRGENFTQEGTQDRNRARVRVRFGLDGQLNQDFVGSFALATGSQGDPTSENETLTNAFDRKTVALDRAYIAYNPVAHPWLSLAAGKFPYLWQRTSVTGDPDLNPEGFDQKLSFNFNRFVQNVSFQTFELFYNDSAAGPDSYVIGAQAQASLQAGPWAATASVLNQHWNVPDGLLQESAFAVAATTTGSSTAGPFPVPGEGQGCSAVGTLPKFAPCAFAPNGMTNATYLDAAGKTHFYSGFDLLDFIVNNQIQTGASQFPINLIAEYEENLDAASHPLSALKDNPVLTSLGSQNKEYGADLSIGRAVRKNDLLFGYSWQRQEQDSVLASIAESDQRAPTNVLQNRIYANWKLRANTLASFTWWRGRVLNTYLENNAALYNNWGGFVSNAAVSGKSTISAPGQQEPWLNRFQFDLLYTY